MHIKEGGVVLQNIQTRILVQDMDSFQPCGNPFPTGLPLYTS